VKAVVAAVLVIEPNDSLVSLRLLARSMWSWWTAATATLLVSQPAVVTAALYRVGQCIGIARAFDSKCVKLLGTDLPKVNEDSPGHHTKRMSMFVAITPCGAGCS
jgi:hypothetical protein